MYSYNYWSYWPARSLDTHGFGCAACQEKAQESESETQAAGSFSKRVSQKIEIDVMLHVRLLAFGAVIMSVPRYEC